MRRLNLVFSDDMSVEEEPWVSVYTSFSGNRRYVEDTTVKRVGKEKRTSIISNSRLWRTYKHYQKHNRLTEKGLIDIQGRELDGRLGEALKLEEAGERVALLGLPYHRFAKSKESIAFFFAACEKIIADLFEWYSKVVFVPPKLSPKKGGKGFLELHDQHIRSLQNSFLSCDLEILRQQQPV